jgi:putative MATE family efflux protein
MAIALTATVARAIGAGRSAEARRIAGAGLVLACAIGFILAAPLWFWRGAVLDVFGATGAARNVADQFLSIAMPSNGLMALGMALQGQLRAVGDAKRAMYVTLFAAAATAALDPILIFGLDLGPNGAAIATVLSRVIFCLVGFWGVVRVHDCAAMPRAQDFKTSLPPILAVAGPVILTNLATPLANVWTTRIFAHFGEEVVAGLSIIDRLTPVAFGALFALTGAIGPIIGQNYGARLFDRVRQTLRQCFALSAGYVAIVWALLYLAGPSIVRLFQASGDAETMVLFFCSTGVLAWAGLSALFVANAAFNNLNFALLATLFNWGRTVLGVGPLATVGAIYGGYKGAFLGVVLGACIFGFAAAFASFRVLRNLETR